MFDSEGGCAQVTKGCVRTLYFPLNFTVPVKPLQKLKSMEDGREERREKRRKGGRDKGFWKVKPTHKAQKS